jgi:uroporphyrin-III C-methyltransferase/precorrin-2 dehydrogenase/sirohydrochlorin ferrochelatase
MSYMPLFFKTDAHRKALIIGGGDIACAKAEALLSCDTQIVVASAAINRSLRELQEKFGFEIIEHNYTASLLDDKAFVVAATNDDNVNQQIADDCRSQRIPVNVVDNPDLCDFIFPALVRRGALQIAISSAGISPVLARAVKQRIEQLIPQSFERLIDFLTIKKDQLRSQLRNIQPRRLFVESLLNGPIAEEALEGNAHLASKLFDQALAKTTDAKQAALYLIGAGPGHEELITLKGIRLISQADVILYDRLIPPNLLNRYARKDAVKLAVGKTRDHHHKKQEDIGSLITKYLKEDKIVVRLKGGDPGIFGHGAEEAAIAKGLDVPYQIVPGISAVTGCAAFSGFPLTERGGARALHLHTLYSKDIDNDAFWKKLEGTHDDTLAFYMSTPHAATLCQKLIELDFAANTPMVLVEQGTTPFHREYPATLETFESRYRGHPFKSPCLLIIGNVTRWQAQHSWREQLSSETGEYFAALPGRQTQPALKIVG